jgi:WhiB family redox-sensing transcriptional regulator
VCAGCQVQAQCLEYALAAERGLSVDAIFGVYGGAGEADRRAMRAGGVVTGPRLLPVVERLASGFKRCCRCCDEDEVLPLSAFGKATRRADGLTAWCQKCTNDYQRERHALRAAPDGPEVALMTSMDWAVAAACRDAVPDLFFPPDDAEDLGWQDRALCAQTDPEVFFPEPGHRTSGAKKVCARCEVRPQCAEYALSNPDLTQSGVWGGLDERDRADVRRQQRSLGAAA